MTSAKLTPAARTRMRIWPGPGTGSGPSRTSSTSGGPVRVIQTDRMRRRAGSSSQRRALSTRENGLLARVARAVRSCFSPRMNLARAFEALAAAYPDRECVVTPTRRVTYGRIADRARRLASVLAAHGLGCRRERGTLANHESGQDHVGLYLLNSPEYLEAMIGCYRARVAPFN